MILKELIERFKRTSWKRYYRGTFLDNHAGECIRLSKILRGSSIGEGFSGKIVLDDIRTEALSINGYNEVEGHISRIGRLHVKHFGREEERFLLSERAGYIPYSELLGYEIEILHVVPTEDILLKALSLIFEEISYNFSAFTEAERIRYTEIGNSAWMQEKYGTVL